MRGWLLGGLLALGLTGTAQAGPYLGGTLDVRIGTAYYNLITAQGGSFSADGLGQAVAGDPGHFLLPITADQSTGRDTGFAAIGSGIRLNNAVDGSSVFRDFGEVFDSPAADFHLYTIYKAPDQTCQSLVDSIDDLAFDGKIGLGGRTVGPNSSRDAYFCLKGRGVAIGGDAVLTLLEQTNYARLPFFEFTAIEAPVAVPEPASMALLLVPMGAAGVIAVRRRSRG